MTLKKGVDKMAEITNNVTKSVTMTNQIMIDGVVVKGQNAKIDQENNNISITDYTSNMELYKANREAIREKMAEFEDMAFQEQEKMSEQLSLKE